MMKSPRDLRVLLRECGFQVKQAKARGKREIWTHPIQPGCQIVLVVSEMQRAHKRDREEVQRRSRLG